MAACPVCSRYNVAAPHVYCTLTCKRDDVTTANVLATLIAAGQSTATAQLTAINTRLATVAPSGDGSEPW